jgi:hypothetical protein
VSTANIDLSVYLDRIGNVASAKTFSELLTLLHPVILDMAQDIEKSLSARVKLREVQAGGKSGGTERPLLMPYSFECYFWAMAILSSAYSAWVYTAKSNDPKYQIENEPAWANAKTAKQYVRTSIVKAIARGRKAGCNKATSFTPQGMKLHLTLRKR